MKKSYFAAVMTFMLVACGFEPLYVQKTDAESKWYFDGDFDNYVVDQMAQIKVMIDGERFGQLIKTELHDLLTPRGVPARPKYLLVINIVRANEYDQALRRDITATRKRIDYKVQYYLEENSKKILKGNSVSFVSYDILDNPYSTVIARQKVQKDAAKILANDIALRLGAFFNAKAKDYEDAEQKDLEQKSNRR